MRPAIVSIIIPAYNAERWIASTIESALAQDWPGKELIIVDDGSMDQTVAVAKTFKSRSVTVVRQDNKGAASARNTGLSLAQGDYIQWLDADDLLLPDKLSRQLRKAEAGTTSRLLLSSAFGTFAYRPHKARFVPSALWRDLDPIEFLLNRFTLNLWMSPGVWLVSRKLTELAGCWDERLSFDDDGEYFSRVVAKSEHIKFVAEARVYYRQAHPGSLSRTVSKRAARSFLLSMKLCIGHLLSLEDSERTKRAGLTLLQNSIDLGNYFYPDRDEFMEEIGQLARELGGNVRPPRLDWKYCMVEASLGWPAVRRAKAMASTTKLIARARTDWVLQALERFLHSQPSAGSGDNLS